MLTETLTKWPGKARGELLNMPEQQQEPSHKDQRNPDKSLCMMLQRKRNTSATAFAVG